MESYNDKLKRLYDWGVSKGAYMFGYGFNEFSQAICLFVASETGGIAFTSDPDDKSIWWAHAYEEKGTIGLLAYKKILQYALNLGATTIKVACINPKISALCKRLKFTCIDGSDPLIYEYRRK